MEPHPVAVSGSELIECRAVAMRGGVEEFPPRIGLTGMFSPDGTIVHFSKLRVRRLTSDPARKYRIPQRGEIKPGYQADLLLFDPRKIGVSPLRRAKDLPGGGTRMLRDPLGVHGLWVNGVQVFDGHKLTSPEGGPGEVLRRFER